MMGDCPIGPLRHDHHGCTLCKRQRKWAADRIEELETLIGLLAHDDPCWFDHHGGCQAHGFLELQHGERCPVSRAQEISEQVEGRLTDEV